MFHHTLIKKIPATPRKAPGAGSTGMSQGWRGERDRLLARLLELRANGLAVGASGQFVGGVSEAAGGDLGLGHGAGVLGGLAAVIHDRLLVGLEIR
jgi:hypothetical protein